MAGQKVSQPEQLHALVLGASGISGWSLLNQLPNYPSAKTWHRISGTTFRPFDLSQSSIDPDPRLNVYSSVDLTASLEDITQSLKRIESIETVTHVFFTAYIEKKVRAELKSVNTQMLENSVKAIESLAPELRAVILQTGGKGYGLEFPDRVPINPPLREDMPRIPQPWRDTMFYYSQYDTLQQLSQSKKWTFAEIRPDGIVGFVPGSNAMNMGQGIALYLTVYRAVHGEGVEVPYPGSYKAYLTKHSDTFQDIMSKMEIFVALKDELRVDGPAYNVADQDEPITWEHVWPGICRFFGLVGVRPRGDVTQQQSMEDFVKTNRATWDSLCEKYSLRKDLIDVQGWAHTHFMLIDFDFDRWFDLSKGRAAGFNESVDTVLGYKTAFERMAAANMIPRDFLQ